MTHAVLLVQGTHGWGRSDQEKEWWDGRSPFCAMLRSHGFHVIGGEGREFIWDTDLDGIGWLQRRPHKKHINWEAAGRHLYDYVKPGIVVEGFENDRYVPIADRNIVAHSHAAQVVAYACAMGLRINRLLTIGSPVREDMAGIYRTARPNIARWLHVHSDRSDRIQWFGTLFDGRLGIVRAQPFADENKRIDRVSHSKLLNDPATFPLWESEGLLRFLGGELPDSGDRGSEPRCLITSK